MTNTSSEQQQQCVVTRVDSVIELSAEVIKGFGRGGKQLGCPTANMNITDESTLQALPTGIYCGFARLNNVTYKTVASVGYNPYYHNTKKTVEPHLILDPDTSPLEDFYGACLSVVLVGYLRPEKDFDSLQALIDAIQSDIESARQYCSRHDVKAEFESCDYLTRTCRNK